MIRFISDIIIQLSIMYHRNQNDKLLTATFSFRRKKKKWRKTYYKIIKQIFFIIFAKNQIMVA